MKYDFDVMVIGGGAGGLFAASVASGLGAKTCIVEKKRLGGDCTWFGCMPSKALLKSASVANLFKKNSSFGLKLNVPLVMDTSMVMSHVRDIVQEISTHHPAEAFEQKGIKVIFGHPKFIDRKTVEVNGQRITSKKFIISTGSHPVVPPLEGLKSINYLTNENIFDLDKLPESLIVLGGGPIGVELAQALQRLGIKVYIVEMMERILFREDGEAAQILDNKLREEGIQILAGHKALRLGKKDNKVYAILEDKDKKEKEIYAENVLVAVGRAPNIEGLSLESAGVEYTNKGIIVNPYLQTANKDIFACGDVVGPYMFTHIAAYQAQVCARNALFKKLAWQKIDYRNVSWAVFTEPELAHLGLTEEEAKKNYKNINVYKTEYGASDRAVTDLEKEGLIKVITDKKGYILGAHIVGSRGSEIIQGLLITKSFGLPLFKISHPLFIYPTLSELLKKTAAKPLLEKMGNPFIKLALRMLKNI